ncbi:MAG: AraC family transcriptional regulator ligand-binding domain-containing protein [Oleispira sp.]|nr:AraC family transcriptional regulator ligand-binding domain-containing protein [Oleispira sp.]MBL4881372.1 AraC family transcriptional regulator ligand-binding domain-containing protein [Oleispira sp.]
MKTKADLSTLEHYVIGSYIQPVLDAYLYQGGRLSVLADSMSVADSWFFHPPKKIAIEQYFQLLLAASDLVNDPYLGIKIGQYAGLASFDVLGQALENTQRSASTLAQALQQVMVLERLVHRLGDSRIEVEGNNVRLIWRARFQQHKAARLVSESVLSGIIQLAQKLTGRLIPVLDVSFVHRQSVEHSAQYYQQAFRAQCRFDQGYNSLLFAADVLAWPLTKPVDAAITVIEGNNILQQVIEQLEQSLMSTPKLSQIAAILGLSERSLQRKLKAEGRSFQQLLGQVRLQQACDYLQYSNLSILHISQLLGFKEQSSFNYFFLQQVGVSPLRYKAGKKS